MKIGGKLPPMIYKYNKTLNYFCYPVYLSSSIQLPFNPTSGIPSFLAIRLKSLYQVGSDHLCRAALNVVALDHMDYFAIFQQYNRRR